MGILKALLGGSGKSGSSKSGGGSGHRVDRTPDRQQAAVDRQWKHEKRKRGDFILDEDTARSFLDDTKRR